MKLLALTFTTLLFSIQSAHAARFQCAGVSSDLHYDPKGVKTERWTGGSCGARVNGYLTTAGIKSCCEFADDKLLAFKKNCWNKKDYTDKHSKAQPQPC
ncbi:hypothetical protein IAQ61_008724 [Plenodomus lingam]|uniref:Predicted protein n=1 Tax=Leptosphaeria maculans (strain JN3 / isolate v23.1.3 / race Av1-4-5-6-7-8) TaxID=985895 RepID=E4ZND5_LEPMJ|nr:predicted protein [Plenodomus lingam JN3]KAH9864779.1 hypothetical protein IAQ61_008724 [Plenodomus lingam]CBX92994.1 predicted protein [Plenodomus lingam JN3]